MCRSKEWQHSPYLMTALFVDSQELRSAGPAELFLLARWLGCRDLKNVASILEIKFQFKSKLLMNRKSEHGLQPKAQGERPRTPSKRPHNQNSTPQKERVKNILSTEQSQRRMSSHSVEVPLLKLLGEAKNRYTGCNCRKSQCLKMYCVCFAFGKMCDETCLCDTCRNKTDNPLRAEAIHEVIMKDPFAFSRGDPSKAEITGEGCTCKKSNCSKKYCACFGKGLKCSKECQCLNCQNPMQEPPSQYSLDRVQKKKKLF